MEIDIINDSTRTTIDILINNLGMLWTMGGSSSEKKSPTKIYRAIRGNRKFLHESSR